jgi:hypothetical protein
MMPRSEPSLGEFEGIGSQLDQTLALMEASVDHWSRLAWCRQVAQGIVQRAGAKTPKEEARAIWAWVRGRVKYRFDPDNVEWIQTPFTTLATVMEGDCDDMATAAGALLGALGHTVRTVGIQWEGRTHPSHAVLEDITAGCFVDPVTTPPESWPPKPVAKVYRA